MPGKTQRNIFKLAHSSTYECVRHSFALPPFNKVGLFYNQFEQPKAAHSLVIHKELSVGFQAERQLIASNLKLLGKEKQANLLLRCGECGSWTWCECGKHFNPRNCNYPRICPECAIRHKNKQILKYRNWLMSFPLTEYRSLKGLRLITLTMESVSNFADGIVAIKHNFRKFRDRDAIKKVLHKGLVCVEKTFNAKTDRWNVHLHIVANSNYINQEFLSKEWAKTTKRKGIVTDIRLCGSYKGSIGYLLKYTTKGSHETPRQKAESFISLYRQKLIYPFGLNNHDKETIRKKKYICKKCGVPREYLSPFSPLFNLIPIAKDRRSDFWRSSFNKNCNNINLKSKEKVNTLTFSSGHLTQDGKG